MNDVAVTDKEFQNSVNGDEKMNSLGDFTQNLFGFGAGGFPGAQLSQTTTIGYNLRWYLISNNRQLLSQLYVEHGIVQTLVNQPVDDGFRPGFEIKTDQIDPSEIEKLETWCERHKVFDSIKQAIKWARLYGGGAIIIVTDQDPKTPLNLKKINKDTPLAFKAVDMWELYSDQLAVSESIMDVQFDDPNEVEDDEDAGPLDIGQAYYSYYGRQIHPTRVFKITGLEAPSLIRQRMRGWGMSEIERMVRSINQYMKNQDVIFELLDEAKVDVYKIQNFNAALISAEGTQQVTKRVQHANIIKNYINAITMDVNDEYEQKQMQFGGIGEVINQIRQGVACDVKMPITKLFGVSAAGFSSGEDDIENYNSMIDSEVRGKSKFVIIDTLLICCQKLFQTMPDDLMINWNPLRQLGAEEEEKVKNSQFNRTIASFQSGLIGGQETKQAINKASLLPIDIDETLEAGPPIAGDFTTQGENL